MDFSSLTSILVLPGIPLLFAPQSLLWLFIVGAVAGFIVAYGIGANDVANAFGTSVGSGAVSMTAAIILASIMEFGGAVALGQAVTQTIRSNIANEACFENDQAELMLGMVCSLLSSGTWLLTASALGLPVSTTHSTVGAIIGFTVASQGWDCVKWGFDGFAAIVLSWFISPVVSGFICFVVYLSAVKFIVKAEYPMERGFKAIPILLCVSLVTVLSLIFFKSPATKDVADWISYVVVGTVGVASLVGGYFYGRVVMLKFIEWRRYWAAQKGIAVFGTNETAQYEDVQADSEEERKNGEKTKVTNNKPTHEDSMVDLDQNDYELTSQRKAMNERREKEKEVDDIFSFFQVFTACFQSFAHGANDVANAVGPFVTVYFLYTRGEPTQAVTPFWILALGGLGIVLGLATFGRAVMATIGKKITHVNFCRGFSVELSATLAVVIASRLGFPISTTHCGVGAVVALGFTNRLLKHLGWEPAEDVLKKHDTAVNIKLFVNIALSWFMTVPVSAIMSGGLFSFMVRFLVREYIPFPTNTTNETTF